MFPKKVATFFVLGSMVLGTMRFLLAFGVLNFTPGGHAAQTFQAVAHSFLFTMFGMWLAHRWLLVWFTTRRGGVEYAIPGVVLHDLRPTHRVLYLDLFIALTVIEVVCVFITVLTR